MRRGLAMGSAPPARRSWPCPTTPTTAPVDVEAHALHVGRFQQIGRGHAQGDPRLDQGHEPGLLGRGRHEVEPRVDPVDRQPKRLQHHEGGLVDGIGRAVAVGQPRGAETRYRELEEITQGDERGFGRARHAGLHYRI